MTRCFSHKFFRFGSDKKSLHGDEVNKGREGHKGAVEGPEDLFEDHVVGEEDHEVQHKKDQELGAGGEDVEIGTTGE